LFVQGGGGENAHDAWDSKLVESLRRELDSDNYEIRYPRMPNEADPRYDSWKMALRNELEKIDHGAIVVGHSIGATILAHSLADEPPKRPPAGIFLVSMPFIGDGGWPSDDIRTVPDLGSRLPRASAVFLYQGSSDATVPPAHVELNAQAIPQAMVRKLAGRDHQLNNDMSEVAADIRKLGP
jgi:predicted alpha/beta hydrolase family esterase